MDVVGIDTGEHAQAVMADGFPERMSKTFKTAGDVMYENTRYGQKNGKGFYVYELDKRGKPKKVVDPAVYELLAPHVDERKEFDKEEMVTRMMLPMPQPNWRDAWKRALLSLRRKPTWRLSTA